MGERFPKHINQLYIMITEQCPMNCSYCYIKDKENNLRVDIEDVNKLISLFEHENPRIIFFGGEPLLDVDLIKQIVDKWKHKCYFQAVTSGVVNWWKFIDEVYLKNKEIFDLQISWDGFGTNRLLKNNKNIQEKVLRTVYSTASKKIPIQIRSVINENNVGDLAKLYLIFAHIRKDFPYFTGDITIAHQQKFPDDFYDLFFHQLEIILELISNDLEKYGPSTFIPQEILSKIDSVISKKTINSCDIGNYIVLRPNGDIYPCTILSQLGDKFCIGNVNNFQLTNLIDKLRAKPSCKFCLECVFNNVCDGGCRYERIINFGDKWEENICISSCKIVSIWYNVINEWFLRLSKEKKEIVISIVSKFLMWRYLYDSGKHAESKKYRQLDYDKI